MTDLFFQKHPRPSQKISILRLFIFVSALLSPLNTALSQEHWQKTQPPALQLAKLYQPDTDFTQYLASEKLDGVRAYWDGKRLISRGGYIIKPPHWFTKNFPKKPLDGELWIARGKFERVSSIIRAEHSSESDWQKVKFMVFDLPADSSIFAVRLKKLQKIIAKTDNRFIALVAQRNVSSQQELDTMLANITRVGGEGLMLHRKTAHYQANRSTDMLKLKLHTDAEAIVIAYSEGKGKYTGLMGAITVINKDGIQFNIGSGFSDKERQFPPKIGSTITYRYRGKTKNNIPRFATYLRQRYLK